MSHSQILVHRWGTQNKDYSAVSQLDITRVKFLLWRRLQELWLLQLCF